MDVSSGASLGAIEAQYRQNLAAFVRVASAIAGDPDAGRDAVHDAFVAAVKARRRYRGDGSIEAWLWRAVVNSARKHRRSNWFVGEAESVAANGSVEHVELRAAIARLPERQRLVLFLRYFADLDYNAIANALEIAPGTVGATLHAAHAALRSRMEVEHG